MRQIISSSLSLRKINLEKDMGDEIDLNAYGNRQARLEALRNGNETSRQEVEQHLGMLHSPERKKKKNDEKKQDYHENLMSNKWGTSEKVKYLLGLPKNTPFRKLNRRLLPDVIIRWRQSWFDRSH